MVEEYKSEKVVKSMDDDILIFTFNGEILFDDICGVYTKYYQGITTKYIIWDFSKANLNKISIEEIRKLAAIVLELVKLREQGTTVLVSKSPNEFGLTRMFTTFSEIMETKVSYKTFKNLQSAKSYLEDLKRNISQ